MSEAGKTGCRLKKVFSFQFLNSKFSSVSCDYPIQKFKNRNGIWKWIIYNYIWFQFEVPFFLIWGFRKVLCKKKKILILGDFFFTMMGTGNIEESKNNADMNVWLPHKSVIAVGRVGDLGLRSWYYAYY